LPWLAVGDAAVCGLAVGDAAVAVTAAVCGLAFVHELSAAVMATTVAIAKTAAAPRKGAVISWPRPA